MEDTKRASQSVTIYAAAAVLIAAVLQGANVDIVAGDVEKWLIAGATFVGGAVTIWGRLRAKTRIEGV